MTIKLLWSEVARVFSYSTECRGVCLTLERLILETCILKKRQKGPTATPTDKRGISRGPYRTCSYCLVPGISLIFLPWLKQSALGTQQIALELSVPKLMCPSGGRRSHCRMEILWQPNMATNKALHTPMNHKTAHSQIQVHVCFIKAYRGLPGAVS